MDMRSSKNTQVCLLSPFGGRLSKILQSDKTREQGDQAELVAKTEYKSFCAVMFFSASLKRRMVDELQRHNSVSLQNCCNWKERSCRNVGQGCKAVKQPLV